MVPTTKNLGQGIKQYTIDILSFIGIINTVNRKDNTPRVSVLMPAYNAQFFIAQAIESILTQTLQNFEFIIINDGSTDQTPEIIRHYAAQDRRIKFIDNPENQGLIAVLNQGLDICRGEYIARMDSDDISLPARLSAQVKYMDMHPNCGVLGTATVLFGDINQPAFFAPVVHLLDLMTYNPLSHPTVMFRKSVIDEHHFRYDPAYKHCEDYELWTRMIHVTGIHNLSSVLLYNRITPTNVTTTHWDYQAALTKKIQQGVKQYIFNTPGLVDKILSSLQTEKVRVTPIRLYHTKVIKK